ncbi:substrate-binding periplasmic protein, partial [Piscirickettsia litoralis]|uniref:substrate-binding periplasmic protein n=1 Tax=Piscirickettsia litoralis TaxID=1891921 RepID=UPI001112D8A0
MLKLSLYLLVLFLIGSPIITICNTLTVCWEEELKYPYIFKNNKGELEGIAYDIVNKAMQSQNITLKHYVYPWKRCLEKARFGHIDLVPNSSYQEKRKEFAFFSKPIYTTHLDLFYRKNNFITSPNIKSLNELKKYRVGGVMGFNYNKFKGI